MSRANKYLRWPGKALEQVSNDFCAGKFQPKNESDVKCHRYNSFLVTRGELRGPTSAHRVVTEFPVPGSRQRVDLALVKRIGQRDEPRLLLEIKETGKDYRPADQIEKRVKRDIEKLVRYKKILLESRSARGCNLVIYFFFRDAGRHGIGIKAHRMLEDLKSKYEDVVLAWGPV
jgi:hypothetical protein